MTNLNDFSSLFELLAGINLAFIAVNYVNNYTNVIANSVFRIEEFFQEHFSELIREIESVKNFIDGADKTKYDQNRERLVREGERYIKMLLDKSDEMKQQAIEDCYFRSFSSTCLWSFVFCFLALLISGFQSNSKIGVYQVYMLDFLLLFALLSLIYFIFCWIFNETKIRVIKKWTHRLSWSLRACLLAMVISLFFLSLGSPTTFMDEHLGVNYLLLPIVYILVPTVNFCFYILPIFTKVSKIKKSTLCFMAKEFKDNNEFINWKNNKIVFSALTTWESDSKQEPIQRKTEIKLHPDIISKAKREKQRRKGSK